MTKNISNLMTFCQANSITSSDLLARFPDTHQLMKRLMLDSLTQTDIDTIKSALGKAQNKDSRSVLDFGKELMSSWLWEEAVAIKLGLQPNPSACDSGRKLLRSGINCQPDMLTSDGKPVEIVVDHKGFISRYGHLDLRGNKLESLLQSNAMIAVAFPNGTITMIDPTKCKVEYLPMHPIWNKPANRITL